eukprot:m.459420 g.459420  ORF g.459420 m.459420 type:complete len:63 (+) comp21740_c0_seq1:765-953(+)
MRGLSRGNFAVAKAFFQARSAECGVGGVSNTINHLLVHPLPTVVDYIPAAAVSAAFLSRWIG